MNTWEKDTLKGYLKRLIQEFADILVSTFLSQDSYEFST